MIAIEELNIREGPGTKYKIIGIIKKGQKIDIVSTEKNWAKLSNNKGYVSALYLTE